MVTIRTFQVNKRRDMLHLQFLASLIYVVHFLLLGAPTGAALNVIGALRDYAYHRNTGRWRKNWPPVLFTIVFITAGAITWQGPRSLLPMFAALSLTIAFWQRSPRMIRLFAIMSPPLWFTYDYLSGSYPGMIAEIFLLSSTIIGIYRFDTGTKPKKKSKK